MTLCWWLHAGPLDTNGDRQKNLFSDLLVWVTSKGPCSVTLCWWLHAGLLNANGGQEMDLFSDLLVFVFVY